MSPPSATASYLLHGVVVRSDLELPAALGHRGSDEPQVVVRLGPQHIVDDAWPPGTRVASATGGGRRHYAVSRLGDEHRIRVHGVAEFRVLDEGPGAATLVIACPDPRYTTGHLAVLFSGTVISLLLLLRGKLVLHGSAVSTGEHSSIAFIGRSGMGKSTLAALFCAAGAALVSDDVLAVDRGPGGLRHISRGACELRLRDGSRSVADLVSDASRVRTTSDGRFGVVPGAVAPPTTMLSSIITPRPTRSIERTVVERLDTIEALHSLLRFPRILALHDQGLLANQFHAAAELAALVPVYRVHIPWGPPFRQGLADEILAGMRCER